ncbi:MAG: hypothetical protein IPH53_12835 [Flavobacteriales bacterium]|nr:hypothetical protein [Flavobacteriales bacterium]
MESWKILMTLSPPSSTAKSVAPPADYVLPQGEWWIGAGVGLYAVGRHWSGEDEELVAAWREAEEKKRDLLYGLYFGRSWHSGFGLARVSNSERVVLRSITWTSVKT